MSDDENRYESQLAFSRRDLLKGLALLASTQVLGMSYSGSAEAATSTPTVTAYGVTTAALKNWAPMEKELGIKMDFTGSNNNVGVFLHEVMADEVGRKEDIFIFEGGTQNILGPKGFYLPLDVNNPHLKLWDRTEKFWKESSICVGKDGKQWGSPLIGNADSFGYFPEKIGVKPGGHPRLSWKLVFDDERTKGRVALGRVWNYTMPSVANYLKASGRVKIDQVDDLKPQEAKQVVDFLIERKKAGQFRTLYSSFEDQVQLLVTKEVDVINCWEPAVRNANEKLGGSPIEYAYTKEGYYKWGHAGYIASQVKKRGGLDNVYKVLNYFLGGQYHAFQAIQRGYGGPNMDLAVKYAKDSGWSKEKIESIKATKEKVEAKFKEPFWTTTTPRYGDVMQEEWQRFLNA